MGWDDADLGRVVRMMADVGYSGSNVTFPFKQQVIDHCDELSDQARVLGAVNTLVFRDGKVRGENTDWIGFSWLVERAFGSIAGASVAQIGTGGAGSATALALAQLGAGEVVLFDPRRRGRSVWPTACHRRCPLAALPWRVMSARRLPHARAWSMQRRWAWPNCRVFRSIRP
jgi:shikimate 5-dehydrogenase